MCASYGLDPRFTDTEFLDAADQAVLEGLRRWASRNAGETLRPTGRNLRNLNPIVVDIDDDPRIEPGWWGYLVGGEPAKFPSINTRSERLLERSAGLKARALVPATSWFEMKKPERRWQEFIVDDGALFAMAAVTQRGRTADGMPVTCYSLVMRPAAPHLAHLHDRMPLLIPAALRREWLSAPGDSDLLQEALRAAEQIDERIQVAERADDKGADRLF